MYKKINMYAFERAFIDMNRGNNFSYAGKKALFEYLEQYEENTGERIDLDVIALCCEYSEYENLAEYNKEHDPVDKIEDIEELTQVIRIDDEAFIIQKF
jgi:hypothetical protein